MRVQAAIQGHPVEYDVNYLVYLLLVPARKLHITQGDTVGLDCISTIGYTFEGGGR